MTSAKVLLGLPCVDGWIRHELLDFAKHCDVRPVIGKPTDVARNFLVHTALFRDYPVVMMVDADMQPAPGSFNSLLEKVLAEPCVAAMPYRDEHGQVAVHTGWNLKKVTEATGWQKVQNIGTGCIAYRTEVFHKISPPYFEYRYNDTHTVLLNSEDCVCHDKLREAGVPIYCDFSRWAGHYKGKIYEKPYLLA